ncbi:MFS transporter [Paenibacillus yanchengensis]|uniref:MFS transporter n=1 Tax=Paenibacillus yanchengensis TaxID=2035833 RepID=A0ABW4YMW4_9BACL
MKKLLWLGCFSYLLIGVAHIIGGSILEQLVAHYQLSYKDGGQWIMNQFLGFLVGVLFTPALSARFGKRATVLFAIGMLTISEAAYSLLLPWGFMLSFAPLAGLGFGMTEAIVGAMIIEYTKDGKATAMSKLETFFGIGALIIPLAAAYLIQKNIWQLSFPILAAMSAVMFILWLTTSFGEVDHHLSEKAKDKEPSAPAQRGNTALGATTLKPTRKIPFGYDASSLPFLAFAVLFFLFYVGTEMSFSNYLPAILLGHTGVSEVAAASSLSVFWGAVVVGRIFAGVLAERLGYTRFLFIMTAGAAIVFGFMTVFNSYALMLVFIALTGLFFAGLFGIALVYANGLLPGHTERTTSLCVAFGGMGGAIFPRITGWFMDQYTISATLIYLAILVVGLFVLMLVLMMIGKKHTHTISNSQISA